ncbi:glycosyl transferase [Natronospirillum operosum]|uniref:Glycosyl transferase n=1 Tax=Natronospirillum operosum TaxID=2759953 RepID=A0A4Z0W8J0_9GAMM|nr:glycosyl transferase [Natronospirillum operosum]TGG94919.1 glycosyl transferase [Natronospirillum operosum]
MGDFFQNGVIANLHNLVDRPVESLEAELKSFSRTNPMALVLPSLYSELQQPALEGMVQALKEVDYLTEVVVGLDRANREEFEHAREYFARMNQPVRILWQDGPRLRKIDKQLEDLGLAPKELGKGRNVWYCYGYILASGKSKAVAMHDCDIKTYSRDMLARLIYPVANPKFRYQFCKGYYARVADNKLNGRVCRLLVSPLIGSLRKVIGPDPFLDYLDSFRYVLSGEFSLRTDTIPNLRIPSDWGLEIGILSELFRNYSSRSVCQVDIADIYDHKHQPLSKEDATAGLSKMSTDISKAVFRKLATHGQVLSEEHFRSIKAAYYRIALDFIGMYYDTATINGLKVDRNAEEEAVELFASNIMEAGRQYLDNPMATPFIPSWNRIQAAVPDVLEQIYDAVELDHNQ